MLLLIDSWNAKLTVGAHAAIFNDEVKAHAQTERKKREGLWASILLELPQLALDRRHRSVFFFF